MLNLSSYSFLSDPLLGGGYILMNGATGAIDLISNPLAHTLMRLFTWRGAQGRERQWMDELSKNPGTHTKGIISDETLAFLQERGHLTKLSAEEERGSVTVIAKALHEHQTSRPIFMIVPSFDCNYRCTYCFERPLQNGLVRLNTPINYAKHNVVMTLERIGALYAAIANIKQAADDATEAGRITLYGGEPLNAANKEVVFQIVEHGVAAGFEFAAITNGHDLEQFLPLLGPHGIKEVQISLDGPQHVHDARRLHRQGEGSFAKLLTNINCVLAQGQTMVEIRIHVDPSNIAVFDESLEICREQGWLDNEGVVVYANTVYTKTAGQVTAGIEAGEIIRKLRTAATPWKNVFVGAPALNARMQVLPSLTEGVPYRLKSTYCAANTGNYIFAPDGHLYACWESVGKECSRVGSYWPELSLDEAKVNQWFQRSIARIPECLACPFALVCGGGCAQYAEYNTGSQLKPYCDDFEAVFLAALADTAEEFISAQELAATAPPNPVALAAHG